MGLFDRVLGSSSEAQKMTVPESFAGVLLGAVASDGHFADEEAQGLFTIISRMQMYSGWNDQQFRQMLDKLVRILKREGVEKLLDKCTGVLPSELYDCAFANACDLVLADGVVEDEEKEFIDDLQKRLGISGDQALTIVDVMIIKNKG